MMRAGDVTEVCEVADELSPGQRRAQWNDRHAGGDFEGSGPNPTLVEATGRFAADRERSGRALELACGSGTNAVWLAHEGWQVTAVDWSSVALENARAKAADAGVEIEWLERNLLEWTPPVHAFDLVAIVYLHLPEHERRPVYASAAAAVAEGGRLVVIAHDRINATEGEGGPPAERLFTAAELARELTADDPSLRAERVEVVRRVPPPGRGPIDALLVLRRGGEDTSER